MSTKEDWPRPYKVSAFHAGYERVFAKPRPELPPPPPVSPCCGAPVGHRTARYICSECCEPVRILGNPSPTRETANTP